MELGEQSHAPAALPPVPIEQEAESARCGWEKIPCPYPVATLDRAIPIPYFTVVLCMYV
jgi:hypothetical protein